MKSNLTEKNGCEFACRLHPLYCILYRLILLVEVRHRTPEWTYSNCQLLCPHQFYLPLQPWFYLYLSLSSSLPVPFFPPYLELFILCKSLMITTALSRLPNDRTNERTAAMTVHVSVSAVVFALCIMYSFLRFNDLLKYLCVASSHIFPVTVPHFYLLTSSALQSPAKFCI